MGRSPEDHKRGYGKQNKQTILFASSQPSHFYVSRFYSVYCPSILMISLVRLVHTPAFTLFESR